MPLFSSVTPAIIFDLLCCFCIRFSQFFSFNEIHRRLQHVVVKQFQEPVFRKPGGSPYENNTGGGFSRCHHILSLYFVSFIKSICMLCIVRLHVMTHRSEGWHIWKILGEKGLPVKYIRSVFVTARGTCMKLPINYRRCLVIKIWNRQGCHYGIISLLSIMKYWSSIILIELFFPWSYTLVSILQLKMFSGQKPL